MKFFSESGQSFLVYFVPIGVGLIWLLKLMSSNTTQSYEYAYPPLLVVVLVAIGKYLLAKTSKSTQSPASSAVHGVGVAVLILFMIAAALFVFALWFISYAIGHGMSAPPQV